MSSNFISLNGEFKKSEEYVLKSDNRAFLYGDALFETMASFNGKIPFLSMHITRLKKSMELLKMRVPFQYNENMFETEIGRLLRKNKFFKGARVRITVYRNAGGLYTPATNDVSFLIQVSKLEFDKFVLNIEGYSIGVFNDHYKPINSFSTIKSTNDLLFILAGIYKKKQNLDECVLLNQNKNVCETLSSNIFVVKDERIYTPSINTGCLGGVMRKNILELTRHNKIHTEEVESLSVAHIQEADECFITNAVNGVRWVGAFGEKRYKNKTSVFLLKELNKKIEI